MEPTKELSKYLVFYGFAKLTKKAVRKRSVVIQYANSTNYNDRQKRYIEQKMYIVHQRYQTINECVDAQYSNRNWTKYEYFIDDKKWKGNLEAILENNFVAEENHVLLEERELIKQKLTKGFKRFYLDPANFKSYANYIKQRYIDL